MTRRYKELGDIISLQYGGSNAHDKIETTRGNSKNKKEIFTTILRHYSNTFTDRVKQESLNLFLGVVRPFTQLRLASDYYLHNTGYKTDLALPTTLTAKWWLTPLLQFEESIHKDVRRTLLQSNQHVFCPSCRKPPVLKDSLLCAYCGGLLRRDAPPLDPETFYSYQLRHQGLIWEEFLEDEKWACLWNVRISHGFCEIDKIMELPCFQPHYLTPVNLPDFCHS